MKHLLVTNDFPPKIGGIQSYLWELWRRLPSEDVTVLTTPYAGAEEFDRQQGYRVVRTRQRWLLPTPVLARQIESLAEETGAELIVLDPGFPLGLIGPSLRRPYVIIGHGAEFTIPLRMPIAGTLLRRTVRRSAGLIGGGRWVESAMVEALGEEAEVPSVNVPPGVDTTRFRPLAVDERASTRARFGVPAHARLVVGVSRLVPRKGFDRLVRAAALLQPSRPDLHVVIAGGGRDRKRLERLAQQLGAPVTFVGRVPDADLPALYGAADVFCMPCHDRWFGLESEGFGIVFVEAAAAGVPAVAGLSGGSPEAVVEGVTGRVVSHPVAPAGVAEALASILDDPKTRSAFGEEGRERAVEQFHYDVLARRLQGFLERVVATTHGV